MKRSERMKVVRSVAEHEERQECRAMGESNQSLEDQLGRLEELNAYRRSYATKGKLKHGVSALQWQDYHKFLSRLDQAVVSQEQVVRVGKSQQEVHQKRWMKKRQRLESLSRIVDRYKNAELDEMERQLNRIQDAQPIRKSPYEKKY